MKHETIDQTLARYKRMMLGINDKTSWFYKVLLKKGIALKKTVDLEKTEATH